jgi:uncharacterized Tic20 family protein
MEFIGTVLFAFVLLLVNAIWLRYAKRSAFDARSDYRENFPVSVAICAVLVFVAILLMLGVNAVVAIVVTVVAVVLATPLYRKFIRKMEGVDKPD